MKKEMLSIPLAALATVALLPLNRYIAPTLLLALSARETVNRMASAQLLTLVLVGLVLFIIYRLNPAGFRVFARAGDMSAPASGVAWLGIREGESWRSAGAGFAVVITLATGLFMWLGVYRNTTVAWVELLPWVLVFSLSNSFSEEMLCRFSLAAGLHGALPKSAVCWWSAAIFGGVHYFGTPGGPVGVLMAGFLGWLMAKSVMETRGMGWAWFIHFLQDVAIIFALLN